MQHCDVWLHTRGNEEGEKKEENRRSEEPTAKRSGRLATPHAGVNRAAAARVLHVSHCSARFECRSFLSQRAYLFAESGGLICALCGAAAVTSDRRRFRSARASQRWSRSERTSRFSCSLVRFAHTVLCWSVLQARLLLSRVAMLSFISFAAGRRAARATPPPPSPSTRRCSLLAPQQLSAALLLPALRCES